ncbi:hypothetical protein [Streptomyces flavidovirens]|uniref:Uncharacterized protein n=1 Tax=Streptomyces flavidovirens TaxID=67298 RepID=A0ABW6RCB2_9ACTN
MITSLTGPTIRTQNRTQTRKQTRTLTARAALAAALGLGALLTVGAPAASAADAERAPVTTVSGSSTAGTATSTTGTTASTTEEPAPTRCVLYIGGTCKVRAPGPGAGIFKPGGHVVVKPGIDLPGGGLNTFDWA